MPRLLRQSTADALHHVYNRCNHQERLLSSDDFQDCCALLQEAKRRFGIRLFAYAFLRNHYHLLLQEPCGGSILSEAMQWFNGSVAVRYNIRRGSDGHLWQGRFGSRIIQGEANFLQCVSYIDLNPARAGLAPGLTDWAFCSARAHVEGTHDPLLDSSPVDLLGYREFFFSEWERTQRLRCAIQNADRAAVRGWLHQAPSKVFIPFRREIAQLIGQNFRRFIPEQEVVLQRQQTKRRLYERV